MPARRSTLVGLLAGVLALATSVGPAHAQKAAPQAGPGLYEPLGGTGLSADLVRRSLGVRIPGLEAPPGLADAAREQLMEQFPGLSPEQAEAYVKRLMADQKLMDRVREKVKERANAPVAGVPPPQLPDAQNPAVKQDVGRWIQQHPPGPNGEPQGAPPAPAPPGNNRPPGNPNPQPQPPARPGNPDQQNGGFRPPQNPPAPAAPPPNVRPPLLPDLDAPETPKEKGMRAAVSLWERNVGPLDETPALKGVLFDIVEGTDDLLDMEGNSFWDTISKEAGDATSFADFIDKSTEGESWDFPKFDLPKLPSWLGGGRDDLPTVPDAGGGWFSGWRSSRPSGGGSPRGPGGSGWSFSGGGVEGSWWPVVILAAVLVGGLVFWRFWLLRDARSADAGGVTRFKDWPVDPREIATRQDVIVTFEYLSVLLCGPAAQTWTHNTIAGALAELAETHGETAVVLARLYELARYAPADEPLTAAEVAEARRLVCGLAGLDDE